MKNINKKLNLIALVLLTIQLIGCSGEDIPVDATEVSKAHVVSLTKVYQQVLHYDCSGNVISDKIEEINGPDKMLEIKPSNHSKNQITASHFINRTTNDSPGVIISHTKFSVDYDGLISRMEVVSGINQIDYSFTFNDDTSEEGARYINVYYSEETKPGSIEFHPSEKECSED